MWIEIFKSGKHIDSSGRESTFTAENLDSIASIYNSKILSEPSSAAPVVKGHPQTDGPAFGWVERLARRGEKLLAKVKDMNTDFVQEVRQGMFKKISISLYPDMLLKHVGFLGAAAPAVKGLKSPDFCEESSGQEGPGGQATTKDEVGKSVGTKEEKSSTKIQQFDGEIKEIPAFAGMTAREDKEIPASAGMTANVNQVEQTPPSVPEDSLKLENEKLKIELELFQKEKRLKEYREFANSLIDNKGISIISPAQAVQLVDILEAANSIDNGKLIIDNSEFAEQTPSSVDGHKSVVDYPSVVSQIKNFVSSLKPQFSLREFAVNNNKLEIFSDEKFANQKVAQNRLELHTRAKQIQSQTAGLSYEEAILMAQKNS